MYPDCDVCGKGKLIPLSGEVNPGTPIQYGAWVCSSAGCNYTIKLERSGFASKNRSGR